VSCGPYRSALADLAVGGVVAPEVETHADSCPSCGGTLATLRARVALMDGELRRLGAEEPGPFFLSRVRSRLARERRSSLPGMRVLLPVLAILAAVGFGLLLARRQPGESSRQAASLTRPEPTVTEKLAAPPAPATTLPLRVARAARPQAPVQEVLVDRAESQALAVLAARLESGRTKPESLRMPDAESSDMKEIAISPLDVRPLDTAPASEDSTERSRP